MLYKNYITHEVELDMITKPNFTPSHCMKYVYGPQTLQQNAIYIVL